MMILISYYNKDRIGYRIIGITESTEEAVLILKKQAKFDHADFLKKIKTHGIYMITSGYMIMDTSKYVDTSTKKYYDLGLPYGTDIDVIDNFQAFAKSYIRNFKIKKII